jgi:hypothetical protein
MFNTGMLYLAFLRLLKWHPAVGVLEEMNDGARSHAGRRGAAAGRNRCARVPQY